MELHHLSAFRRSRFTVCPETTYGITRHRYILTSITFGRSFRWFIHAKHIHQVVQGIFGLFPRIFALQKRPQLRQTTFAVYFDFLDCLFGHV